LGTSKKSAGGGGGRSFGQREEWRGAEEKDLTPPTKMYGQSFGAAEEDSTRQGERNVNSFMISSGIRLERVGQDHFEERQ